MLPKEALLAFWKSTMIPSSVIPLRDTNKVICFKMYSTQVLVLLQLDYWFISFFSELEKFVWGNTKDVKTTK